MKTILILAIAFMFFVGCNSSQNSGYMNVDVPEFKKMMSENNVVILDVRTPSETSQGMIKGAIEIDYKASGFDEKLDKLDKNKKYLVYCKSGGRSSRTAKKMVDKGFTNIVNLKGGYTAWSK